MFKFSRAVARALMLAGLFGLAAALPALAADPLTLGETVQLAIQNQPLLQAQSDAAAAARERAVAAGQLPDPQLKTFVQNLPANTSDAWRFNRDFMTMTGVGVMQEMPLPGKRRLRTAREEIRARVDDAMQAALARGIERDAGIAWVNVWTDQQAQALLAVQLRQAREQEQSAAITYKSGGGNQADVLAARVAAERLADRRDAEAQKLAAARAALARWIGAAAERTLPNSLPPLSDPPPLSALLAALPRHPALIAAARRVNLADNGIALARQSYWPDWRFEVDYAYRQHYSEMVSLSVGIDLPIFPGDRQDRELSASRSDAQAALAERDDLLRRLTAEARADYLQWQTASSRLARYDRSILPQSAAAAKAALADYRAGRGAFASVIDARLAALDADLERLQLAAEVARLRLSLRYFEPTEAQP